MHFIIRNLQELTGAFTGIKGENKYPLRLDFKFGETRSLNQNGLYWQWMGLQAKHFSKNGSSFDKDDMHDMMRHKFLGYEDRRIGKTIISNQLKSTTKLSKGEMFEYMEKVDAWSVDMGLRLPIPEESEYKDILDKQNA